MKKIFWIIAISIIFAGGWGLSSSRPELGYARDMGGGQEYQEDRGEMDMDYIYDYLEPYGNWIEMESYGYVWTPRDMGYRWRPYSSGRWVSTDYGWTWVANERWGSIPFHYGRWGYNNDFGWYWVPGTVWGPAWVSWRWSSQYVGWAPLPPGAEFRANVGFGNLSIRIPNRFWVFLQGTHFMDHDVYRYALPYERNSTIINFTSLHHNIRFKDNRVYNEGIGIDYVRRATRQTVSRYTLRDVRDPGSGRVSGRDVHVYRPNFRGNNRARPKTFMRRDDARRKLNSIKVFDSHGQQNLDAQKNRIQRRQAQKRDLLKITQEQELRHVQAKRKSLLELTKDRTKKERVAQDSRRKIENLRERHQVESQELTKRHRQDLEKVNKVTQKRAQEVKNANKNRNGKKKNKNGNKNENKHKKDK
jgi:hypothetical protein